MRAVDMPAALDYAHRLLEYAYDPPYLLDTQDVPDLENLVRVLEEQRTPVDDSGHTPVPQVTCVRPWEGDAAVAVEGRIVYRFPDEDPAFSNTAQAVAERLAEALGCMMEEVELEAEDWCRVEAMLAERRGTNAGR
jgi:hypothetical protein